MRTPPAADPVSRLADRLRARRERLAVAESCTGGLLGGALTAVPGSSDWFERGVISYSNDAKRDLLGVGVETLEKHGAVSAECASAMADGLLARAPVQWTVAITGIAGPGGATAGKPVGTVFIAVAGAGRTEARQYHFAGDRDAVRAQSVQAALDQLLQRLET